MSRGRRILIGAAIVLFVILAIPASLFVLGFAHFYYLPSESMEPTMAKGDRFVAWMRAPAEYRRGDIVLVEAGRMGVWVKRVVGLPGDQIQMIDGAVILNGRTVPRQVLQSGIRRAENREPATLLREQFPGEANPHRIYDTGHSEVDDMEPQRIAPGHLFVIGDNRDDSADSRLPADARGIVQGLGQVPFDHVIGVPWFYHSWHRFGEAAGH